MKSSTLLALLLVATTGFSQNLQGRFQYFMKFNNGFMLFGSGGNRPAYTVSMVHGATISKRFRLGAGVGFDQFPNCQALPIFGNASFDFLGKRNTLFLEVNYGWAMAWLPTPPFDIPGRNLTYEFQGGRMFNPMLGYRIGSGGLRAYITAGYKYQYTELYYALGSNASFPNSTEYHGKEWFDCFVATIGIGWR